MKQAAILGALTIAIGLGLILWMREGGRVWMSAWAMFCG